MKFSMIAMSFFHISEPIPSIITGVILSSFSSFRQRVDEVMK